MGHPYDFVKKNFGFGCLRLPMNGSEVDHEHFSKMVDLFMENGFNYFDTAHTYIDGKSENAIRECIVKRYPRESFVLVNKLTNALFDKQEDIVPFFETQLEACGVDYFDFYFMHGLNAVYMEKFKRCKAFETVDELMRSGKIRHFGISFHDSADVLEGILKEYPQIEVVQIQFNYLDYDDNTVQARKCYEVCRKYGKPVIVMEPVRGGRLTELPTEAKAIFDQLGGSPASYAIRYAASFDNIMMVLSGMSNLQQTQENISFMKDFQPLDETEMKAVYQVRDIIRKQGLISCTTCRYCVSGCPRDISIPDLFTCYNNHMQQGDWIPAHYYKVHTRNGRSASACISCGTCEKVCPQHLKIRELLKLVANHFEK